MSTEQRDLNSVSEFHKQNLRLERLTPESISDRMKDSQIHPKSDELMKLRSDDFSLRFGDYTVVGNGQYDSSGRSVYAVIFISEENTLKFVTITSSRASNAEEQDTAKKQISNKVGEIDGMQFSLNLDTTGFLREVPVEASEA